MRIATGLVLILVIVSCVASAQDISSRKIAAIRTDKSVKLDGIVSELAWQDAALMNDFVEFQAINWCT